MNATLRPISPSNRPMPPAGKATTAPQQGMKAKMPAITPRQIEPMPNPMHMPLLLLLSPVSSRSRRRQRRRGRS